MTIGSGLRQKQKKKRGLAVILVIVMLMGIAASWQLVSVSGVMEKLKGYFSSNDGSIEKNEGVRGTIYDRNYKELAVSLPRVSVFARSRELQDMDAAAESLAEALGLRAEDLLEKLRVDSLRIWLAKDITQQQEEVVKRLGIPGVYLSREYPRYYPQENIAAHLVGFVEDDIGLSGAEYYYDQLVQKMLAEDSGSVNLGGLGQHVLLTIDLKIQAILENLISDIAKGRGNVKIGAYAMDAGTGALIGAAQFPSFNPNRYRKYSQSYLENLLVKPMLLPPAFRIALRDSAAIQSQYEARGQVHPWSVSARQLSLGGELRLWERLGLGAKVPKEFGNNETQLARAAETFVVSDQHGYDFGTVPESLSPLNLLSGMSSLVNGGRKIEPYLFQAVFDDDHNEEFQLRPLTEKTAFTESIDHGASREVSHMIAALGQIDSLGGTTLYGDIRAEIGTGEGYGYVRNQLYFSAIPAEKTELTLILTIQGAGSGGPEQSEVNMIDPGKALAEVIPRLAVLQEVGKSIASVAEPKEGDGGNYPMQLDTVREAVRNSSPKDPVSSASLDVMPSLIGNSLRKSLRLLQTSKCTIRIYGTGRVISQEPAAGASLAGVSECVIRMQQQEEVSLEALEEKMSK